MARKTSKRTGAKTEDVAPKGLVKFLGLLSTSGLPGRMRVLEPAEIEELNKVIESINEGPKGLPVGQQFWTNDADVDCALAAALFVTAGAALAVGAAPVAVGLAAAGAKSLNDAWKGVNKDTKSGCGMEILEEIASLDARTLQGATNSISFSGLMAAREILISAASQQAKSQQAKSPK